jgi:hypothetical protein
VNATPAASSHDTTAEEVSRLALDVLRRGVLEHGRSADWRTRRLLVVAAMGLFSTSLAALNGFVPADRRDPDAWAPMMARLPLEPGSFIAEAVAAWGSDGDSVNDIEQATLFLASSKEAHWRAAEAWIARHPQYRAGLAWRQIVAVVH